MLKPATTMPKSADGAKLNTVFVHENSGNPVFVCGHCQQIFRKPGRNEKNKAIKAEDVILVQACNLVDGQYQPQLPVTTRSVIGVRVDELKVIKA